jgi:maleate isomerase
VTALQEVAARLLAATGASRVTVRGPGGGSTTALLAECLAPGVPSMAGASQEGIVEAPTYVYLREQREPLLQDDCRDDPRPPAMLTERFGVGAQMLGPLLDGDALIGTVSVHQQGGPRHWTQHDRAALDQAVTEVQEIIRTRA